MLANGEAATWLRCGNRRCRACDLREALELGRVLQLDALTRPIDALLTLTTHDPADAQHGERFRRSFEKVVKALRRRWPEFEYCAFIEFTTGRGERSGGHRRMHAHVLVRGIGSDLEAVRRVAADVWCARMTGTRAAAQDIRPIEGIAGLMHYLAHHHRKPGQAPPDWWTGKRTRPSRRWWSRPIAELRAEAAEVERLVRVRFIAERRVRANLEAEGLTWIDAADVDALVADELQRMEAERLASPPWRLWHLGADFDGQPRPWHPVPRE